MVQQSQFDGSPMKDPNLHLSVFLEVWDTLKINGTSTDAIHLCLFLFSLRNKERALPHSLPSGQSQRGMNSPKSFLPSSSHQTWWQAWKIKSPPSLKEKTNDYMRHGSGSRTCWGYAHIMVCKSGWWSRPSTMQWLNRWGPWSMRVIIFFNPNRKRTVFCYNTYGYRPHGWDIKLDYYNWLFHQNRK